MKLSVLRLLLAGLFCASVAQAAAESTKSTTTPLLLVLNKSENTLVSVDPATLKVLGRYPTGNGPHEVTVSADGSFAYVSNYGTDSQPGHTLSVIDLAAGKSNEVDLGKLQRPHELWDRAARFTSPLRAATRWPDLIRRRSASTGREKPIKTLPTWWW